MKNIKNMKKIIVYIDGFNLFYRLREYGQSYKWLDVEALSACFIEPDCELVEVKFFTARLNGYSKSKHRQSIYLDALKKHCPKVSIIEGYFTKARKCRNCDYKSNEEKQTDVNIACEMLSDCYENKFDFAYLLSGDSDLVMPVKKISMLNKVVIILNAKSSRKVGELNKVATKSLYINDTHLKKSQLPEEILTKRNPLRRPKKWQK